MINELHLKYHGIVPPILTPFKEDKSICYETYEKFIDWLCDRPVDMLFAMGGSSEYATLTLEERHQIIDILVRVAGKRKITIAGTGADNLVETIRLSRYAEEAGADAIGVIVPTDIPANPDSIFEYYQAVSRAVSLPIMIYDPRGDGPYSVDPSLMRRMIDELENIVAIKYRTVDGERMGYMAMEIADDISLLSGAETVYLQDMTVGAVGCVGGGANFYPQLIADLQTAFHDGNLEEARRIHMTILKATQVLDHVYWPLSGKIILRELGLPFEPITRVAGKPFEDRNVDLIRTYYRQLLDI